MEASIICPHCYTDITKYKCEFKCNHCDTNCCLSCKKYFYTDKNISYKGHYKLCYIKSKL